MIAATFGYTDILTLLISNKALLNDQDRSGGTALMKAAAFGHLGCAIALTDAGATVDLEDKEGFSALMLALLNGQEEVAKHLLDCDADFASTTESGDSPFFISVMLNLTNVTQALQRFPTALDEISGRHKQTILHRIMLRCGEDQIMELLESWEKIYALMKWDLPNRMGQPPLFYAAHFNHLRPMKFLLDHGADPFSHDKSRNNALHFCTSAEAVNLVVDSMKKNGSFAVIVPEVNCANQQGNTPLHSAYAFGENLEMVRALTQHGADISTKNRAGNVPHQLIMADRRRLLPFYASEEEAPHCGGLLIGTVHGCVDPLIPL
jgi:uncharacterized protein